MLQEEIYNEEENPELWDYFSAQTFPETKWRIHNLIPESGVTILAGSSGDGKSWLALEMAKALSFGSPFLNCFDTKKSTVLYINQEMAKTELHRRGKLIGLDGNLGRLWILNKNEFNLNEEGNIIWLINFIKERGIEVVIIDTFRAVAGEVKDDDARDISTFFQRFRELKEKGVSLIFLDHTRKPERFDGKIPKREQLFGSQYKLGAVEVLIMLKMAIKDTIREFSVYQLKNRLGVELKPFKAHMADVMTLEGKLSVELTYQGEFEEKESKKDEAKEFILSCLQDSGRTRKELIDMALKDLKIGQKNTSDAIRELENGQKIEMIKQGRQNFYFLPSGKETEEKDNLLI